MAGAVSWTQGGEVATVAPAVSPAAARTGDADSTDAADGELAGADDSEAIT